MKTIEENKKIINEYPFLRSMWWDRDTQSYKWNYKTTVLDDVPKGWEDLILCMAEDIKPLLEESGQLNDFFTEQVKEKFGGLRFYHNQKCPEEVNEIIHDYAILSENICYFGKHIGWKKYMDSLRVYERNRKLRCGKSDKYVAGRNSPLFWIVGDGQQVHH